MENYKKALYDSYLTTQNKNLYGDNSLAKIVARDPYLHHYYGRHAPENKSARVLDLGCGDGYIVYHLQQLGYTNVTGVDVSPEQVDEGIKMGVAGLVCGDFIDYLKSSEEQFDMIIAKDVLEHFTRQEVFDICLLISSKLAPGGKFLIQAPNGEGIFYTSVYYGDFTHEMAFTHHSLSQILLNTGFSKANFYPTGPLPVDIKGIIRYVLWSMYAFKLKFWKMVETGSWEGIFTQNIIAVAEK